MDNPSGRIRTGNGFIGALGLGDISSNVKELLAQTRSVTVKISESLAAFKTE